ncbi:MAG TPA: hypothetical protein VG165_10990 [Solirubrobacteraceae bacterium]|jgi:tetratricopeptide (TPR) repeat protein|nr:hypothetical protein [Solirubrobacteraceae bacterium]
MSQEAADSGPLELLRHARELREAARHEEAIAAADDLLGRLAVAPAQAPQVAFDALLLKAANLFDLDRPDDGLALYAELLDTYAEDPSFHVRAKLADALAFKGHLLFRRPGAGDAAVAAFDDLARLLAGATEPQLREKAVEALTWKAAALVALGRRDEADDAYRELAARLNGATEPALAGRVASARAQQTENQVMLGDLLLARGAELVADGRWADALDAFAELVGRLESVDDDRLRSRVVLALSNSVAMLMELDRPEDAAATHRELVVGFGDAAIATFDALAATHAASAEPGLRRHAVGALVNKAGVLRELDRRDAAVATFDEVISGFADDDDAAIQGFVEQARYHRAGLLAEPAGEGRPGSV